MPGNNFEDEVRKKMEELRFVPSGEVWTQVEEKIRQDRRRRRFLFWLPLTGLLVGGFIWLAWPGKTEKAQAHLHPQTTIVPGSVTTRLPSEKAGWDSAAASTIDSAISGTSVKPETVGASGKKDGLAKTNPIATEAEYLASVSRAAEKHRNSSSLKPPRKQYPENVGGINQERNAGKKKNSGLNGLASGHTGKPVSIPEDPAKTKTQGGATNGDGYPAEEDNPEHKQSNPNAANTLDDNGSPALNDSSLTSGKDKTAITKADPLTKDVPAPATNKKLVKPASKKNRIEWGFTVSGGVSEQLEQNAINHDVLARALSNSTVYVIQRSEINVGPAFSAGIVAAKQIGKTWRLQTGLQYAYISSRLPNARQRVLYAAAAAPGNFLNFAANYAPGNGNSKNSIYNNKYQFFQIPVTVEKQFGARSPLSVQAGLVAGYLSGIHTLIYEPLLDQYSQDNSKYSRFQLSGLAGIYWKFKVDQHWSLRAGPELQYQFTDLMKSSVPLNDHLLTGALRITLMHSK